MRWFMRAIIILLLLFSLAITASAQQPDSGERLRELERKLDEATRQIEQLGGVIQSLRAEISAIKGAKNEDRNRAASRVEAPPQTAAPAQSSRETINADFVERIIDPKLGRDERDSELKAKPEVFIQARYSALPIRGGEATFKPNFRLTRIESRWAGKVTDR